MVSPFKKRYRKYRTSATQSNLINGGDCNGLNCVNKLSRAGLISLEKRREWGDQIQGLKLIKGIDNADYSKFFTLAENSRTRGHSYKLLKDRARLDVRGKFFSQRVVNCWNSLPATVVDAESVNSFKNRLDNFWKAN